MWACMEGTKHFSLWHQETFLGASSQDLDLAVPRARQLPGLGMQQFSFFVSPWAQTEEEENTFKLVVTAVGKLVTADRRVAILFQALLVADCGGAALAGLRSQLTTLLYRQLVELQGIVSGAATTHELLGWVEQLRQCGNTIMHRRIIC